MYLTQFINSIIDRYGYRSYLELGCFDEHNFNSIEISHKIGVNISDGSNGTMKMPLQTFFESNSEKFDIILVNVKTDLYKHLRSAMSILHDNGCVIVYNHFSDEDKKLESQVSFSPQDCEKLRAMINVRYESDFDSFLINCCSGIYCIFKSKNSDCLSIPLDNITPNRIRILHNKFLRTTDLKYVLSILPKPNRNIKFISAVELGRIGHQFYDIISGFIISEIFGFNHHQVGWLESTAGSEIFDYSYKNPRFDYHQPVIDNQDVLCNRINIQVCIAFSDNSRWAGFEFNEMRRVCRSIPEGVSLSARYSTRFNINSLYENELNGNIIPGTFNKIVDKMRSIVMSSKSMADTVSDFDCFDDSILTIAVFIRLGGSLNDVGQNQTIDKKEYDVLIDKLRLKHSNEEIKVIYYTQGPIDTISDYAGCDVRICDDELPRLYNVIKSIYDADIFISGFSSFSVAMAVFRNKPTYTTDNNPHVVFGLTQTL